MSSDGKLSKEQIEAVKRDVLNAPSPAAHKQADQDSRNQKPHVGYKNPPKHSRFKKGVSGNPKGRPKKKVPPSAAIWEPGDGLLALTPSEQLIADEASRMVPIKDNGQAISMPMAQAVVRSTFIEAAKGRPLSQKLVLDFLQTNETKQSMIRAHLNAAWADIQETNRVTLERIANGEDLPLPLPHPDDILLSDDHDPKIVGPTDGDEQAALEERLARREHLMLEHIYCLSYGSETLEEREHLRRHLQASGLDHCHHDLSEFTGPFIAILLLERGVPPRLRWSLPDWIMQQSRAIRAASNRRVLEKLLTQGRKRHRLPFKRGQTYPSAAFELDMLAFTQDILALQKDADQKAKERARTTGNPINSVRVTTLDPDLILSLFKEHALTSDRLRSPRSN
ncbi:MAG: DUF5681 domain-containing protein [Pseudomonadota bacterium]